MAPLPLDLGEAPEDNEIKGVRKNLTHPYLASEIFAPHGRKIVGDLEEIKSPSLVF